MKHCSWWKYIQVDSSESVVKFPSIDHCIALICVYFSGEHREDGRSLFSFFKGKKDMELKSKKGNDGKQKWRELKMAEVIM
jgi:hypothetical protein